MKFTQRWLAQHIDTALSPEEIGTRLTMAGLELDSLTHLGAGLEKVQVGTLESVERHPNADRLTRCRVRIGDDTLPIVCGATNHKAGDKVAVARVGASLPNGLTIKKGKIRGEESHGMLCSTAELGITESADGILILPPETPEGRTLAEVLERNDHLFEVDLTPNRGDCLGVRGIARDLGAVTGEPLLPLDVAVTEDPAVAERHPVRVVIEDPAGCPRYAGRVISGVTIGPSPDWLRNRLEAVGLRAINNVVDVTNYVMLDLGQPLHAFDLAKLAPPVVVRKAAPGERITTLDEVERTLEESMTLIADQARPLALAGIMGGEESGVDDGTSDLFLESAWFEPVGIARTGRKLGLISDSRYRFERGTDPEGLVTALDLATRLIIELAGGTAGPARLVDAGTWQAPAPVPFRHARAVALAGIALAPEESAAMLARLGCVKLPQPAANGGDLYQPPSHRHDLVREEDLVEEIVRLYGYDRVPAVMPATAMSAPPPDAEERLTHRLRRAIVGLGYLEAINYAFVGQEAARRFDADHAPIALLNPISEEQGVMRTSLMPGLVESAQRNLSRGNGALRLFEVGRVFHQDAAGTVTEPERLGLLLSGPAGVRAWHTPQRTLDLFDLKGDLEAIAAALRLPELVVTAGGPDFLHPGRKGLVTLPDGAPLGWLGQLHPAVQEALDLSQPLLLAELDAAALVRAGGTPAGVESISRYPAVERDFAFLLPVSVPAQAVMAELRQVAPALVRQVALFDLYSGQHVPAGQKSLALGVTLQADDRTLTDQEAQQVADAMVQRLAERFGATLRGA